LAPEDVVCLRGTVWKRWTRVTNQGTGWIIPGRNMGGARHRVSRYKKRQRRCRRMFRRQRQQPRAFCAGVDVDAGADADRKKQWNGHLALGGRAFICSRGILPGGFGLRLVRGGAIQGDTDEDAEMSAEQETRSDCSFNPVSVFLFCVFCKFCVFCVHAC